jgi:hypothetical protein
MVTEEEAKRGRVVVGQIEDLLQQIRDQEQGERVMFYLEARVISRLKRNSLFNIVDNGVILSVETLEKILDSLKLTDDEIRTLLNGCGVISSVEVLFAICNETTHKDYHNPYCQKCLRRRGCKIIEAVNWVWKVTTTEEKQKTKGNQFNLLTNIAYRCPLFLGRK